MNWHLEEVDQRILFHYPILMWHRKGKGAYHIYRHLHNERKGESIEWLVHQERALNACVEINHYEPCPIEELILNNEGFRQSIFETTKQ